MSKPQSQRKGQPLIIGGQEIRFSKWPARKKGTKFIPQAEILTKNPWEAIDAAIGLQFDARSKQYNVIISFLLQAQDFYRAYETARISSKPLLLYYSFLNLAKTFILYRKIATDLSEAVHGISENRKGYTSAIIKLVSDNGQKKNIYDLFSQALGNSQLAADQQINLSKVALPQIVIGHRLWAQAKNARERFLRAEKVAFLHDADAKSVWTNIDIKSSDLELCGVNQKQFLKNSGLTDFSAVKPVSIDGESASYLNKITH